LDTGLAQQVLSDCVERVSPAYAIFRGGAPEAGPLVDLIVAEKLKVPGDFAQKSVLGSEALALWSATAIAAKPYRDAMQTVVDYFPRWWQPATPETQAALKRHLPSMAQALADLGDEGVRDLIVLGEPALACAAQYSAADKASVRGVAVAAKAGAEDSERCGALLDQLRAAFPVSLIEEDREAARILPALGRAVSAAGAGWSEVLELALLLIPDPSSAHGVLNALPKALTKTPGQEREYLSQCVSLIGAIGPRVSGLALGKLPGAANAAEVTKNAVELARAYGSLAAERWLEKAL
jgi:hypothetical protein